MSAYLVHPCHKVETVLYIRQVLVHTFVGVMADPGIGSGGGGGGTVGRGEGVAGGGAKQEAEPPGRRGAPPAQPGDLGERCKAPPAGPGRSPRSQRFLR